MFELIFEVIIILFLAIECWLIYLWSKQHSTLMSIISYHIAEIKKKINTE